MNLLEIKPQVSMVHRLTWYKADKVLLLEICGNYSLEDSAKINQFITDELNLSQSGLILFIDATKMERPHHFTSIRSSQAYMNHPKLRRIYVVATDRLVRLAMTVIFHLSHSPLQLFEDFDKATQSLEVQMG